MTERAAKAFESHRSDRPHIHPKDRERPFDAEGRVILQSVWCVDRRGRRVTEIEVIPNEAALLRRLGELARLFGARAQ